jgi:hypothetical protein
LGEQEKQLGTDFQNIFTGKVSPEKIPAPIGRRMRRVRLEEQAVEFSDLR